MRLDLLIHKVRNLLEFHVDDQFEFPFRQDWPEFQVEKLPMKFPRVFPDLDAKFEMKLRT